jgi:hypothetical protein
MFSQTRTRSPGRVSGGCVLGETGRTVPVGDVLVGDARGDVEHDDAALAVDVVAIAQTAKLLLAGRVPDVELDGAEVLRASVWRSAAEGRTYGGEAERVHLDTERRDVLLLELARQMALDKGRLRAVLACRLSRVRARASAQTAEETHLSSAAVADKHQLEGGYVAGSFSHGCGVLWRGVVELRRLRRRVS